MNSAKTWGRNRCHTRAVKPVQIPNQLTRPIIWTMLRDFRGKPQIHANINRKSVYRRLHQMTKSNSITSKAENAGRCWQRSSTQHQSTFLRSYFQCCKTLEISFPTAIQIRRNSSTCCNNFLQCVCPSAGSSTNLRRPFRPEEPSSGDPLMWFLWFAYIFFNT